MDYGVSDVLLWHRIRNYHARFPGTITLEDLKSVIAASGRKCCWCGKEDLRGGDLTFEHLEHRNASESMAVACASCNYSKRRAGAKRRAELPEEVLQHREAMRHRKWEKENRAAQQALRKAEYLRHKNGYIKRYLEANRERILADRKSYREENRAELIAKRNQWEVGNKERHAAQRKEWREANPEVVKQRWAEYGESHRDELNKKAAERAAKRDADPAARAKYLERKRAAYQANAEQRRADAKAYVEAHREEINAKKRARYAALKAAATTA